jgi:peptidoglycan/xylan/chitin deacetylase (PgdA/CDA1 family)
MRAARCLVVTYHAIGSGTPPLQLDPPLFELHAERLAGCGVVSLTVSELADALRRRRVPDRAVAITFDDGLASVAEHALPALERHGLRATVFAVSGRLGGWNDWPTQPASVPRLPLLDADGLRRLADHGWEIGGHGVDHRPLTGLSPAELFDELDRCRTGLAHDVGVPVTSFAFPYGLVPEGASAALEETGYTAACGGRLARVTAADHPLALPRVDAHYLRRSSRLAQVATGRGDRYLAVRRVGARARRLFVADHEAAR